MLMKIESELQYMFKKTDGTNEDKIRFDQIVKNNNKFFF
jgi:hypothetical protein